MCLDLLEATKLESCMLEIGLPYFPMFLVLGKTDFLLLENMLKGSSDCVLYFAVFILFLNLEEQTGGSENTRSINLGMITKSINLGIIAKPTVLETSECAGSLAATVLSGTVENGGDSVT